jgi:Lamin Tail Domain
MKRTRTAPVVATALAALFFTAVFVFAATTTLFVYPGHLEGWQPNVVVSTASPSPAPTVEFVFGPGTPPLGRGSAELRVGSDGDNAAELRQPNYNLVALPNPSPTPPAANELTALAYSTYAQSGGSGGQTPYLILNIDNNNDGVFNIASGDDQLFFEPVYQNGTYPTVDPSVVIPNQCGANPACVTPGEWQTWDALGGGWWALSAGTFGPPLTTLEFYRQTHPNARIINSGSGLGGVRVVAGFGAGAWDDFVGNVDNFQIGVGPDTTVYDFEPQAPPPPTTGGVKISELRTSGPGGGDDEYVELYNTSAGEIAVQSADGSAGWTLVKRGANCTDPPVVIATIPNGTIIPGRGHLLIAGGGYTLAGYPSVCNCTPTLPDLSLSAGIQDNRNVGLFNTTDSANFDAAHRLDAVGFDAGSGNTCDLLAEGTKLLAPRGSTAQHAFVRKETTGVAQDSGNNCNDFWTVSTEPALGVGDNPTPVLGAPGPQNTISPTVQNASVTIALTAPTISANSAPNRQRDFNVEPCAAQGNLYLRRRFTNNSSLPITRLRFRVADITTLNSPGYTPTNGQADLRVRSSPDETIFVPGRGTVQVQGLDREQPPNQSPPECGGYNTSLAEDTITFADPLDPGESIDAVFRLGLMKGGTFRFYFNIEVLDTSAPPPPAPPAVTARRLPGTR